MPDTLPPTWVIDPAHERDIQADATRLPQTHIRLGAIDAIYDQLSLPDLQHRLWRDNADEVERAFAFVRSAFALDAVDYLSSDCCGRHGLHAERMRELYRPIPARNKRGLTVAEIAKRTEMDRETLACLMEHHGYLELVPYGGRQRRRLVTDEAFAAGFGHNVDASHSRIAAVEGRNRASVFPVFYPERLADILWTLDHPGIAARAAAIANKRDRLRWLLETHAFLPNDELARLSGCSLSGVKKAQARAVGQAVSPSSIPSDGVSHHSGVRSAHL